MKARCGCEMLENVVIGGLPLIDFCSDHNPKQVRERCAKIVDVGCLGPPCCKRGESHARHCPQTLAAAICKSGDVVTQAGKEFAKAALACMEAGHWQMKSEEPYICYACHQTMLEEERTRCMRIVSAESQEDWSSASHPGDQGDEVERVCAMIHTRIKSGEGWFRPPDETRNTQKG